MSYPGKLESSRSASFQWTCGNRATGSVSENWTSIFNLYGLEMAKISMAEKKNVWLRSGKAWVYLGREGGKGCSSGCFSEWGSTKKWEVWGTVKRGWRSLVGLVADGLWLCQVWGMSPPGRSPTSRDTWHKQQAPVWIDSTSFYCFF